MSGHYRKPVTDPPDEIRSLSDDVLEHVGAQVQVLISAVVVRVHYAETRRTSFGNVGGAIFAGGLGLASLAAANRLHVLISVPAFGIAITSILYGLFVWLVYFLQTNKYPWTDKTYTWKWFYRDALPDVSRFRLTLSDTLSLSRSNLSTAKSAYTDQLIPFAERITKIVDKHQDLWQDVQQLYTLHINEAYKNLHLTQLRQLLKWYVFALPLLGLIFFLSGVASARLCPNRILGNVTHQVVNATGVVVGKWRLASYLDTQLLPRRQLLVQIPLAVALRGVDIEARDAGGTLIPIDVNAPTLMHGGPSDNVWITATVQEDFASSISKLAIRAP